MIDTHRFAAYVLLYLFSGGFRGTSLFTNEAMFFVTYAVRPVSILQKSDKNLVPPPIFPLRFYTALSGTTIFLLL